MNDMDEARKLATRIVKESDCVVKFGRTNGKLCLHLRIPGKASVTIYGSDEWDKHNWNHSNRPRKKKPAEVETDITIRHAVANREAA